MAGLGGAYLGAWIMGSASTPLAWYVANIDLMVLCWLVSAAAAGITIFLDKARGSSVVVAILAAFLFTSLGVPTLAIRYGWYWSDLAMVSAIIGFGALTLAFTARRISSALQERVIGRVEAWDPFGPAGPAPHRPVDSRVNSPTDGGPASPPPIAPDTKPLPR